jgi:hypothetical protein
MAKRKAAKKPSGAVVHLSYSLGFRGEGGSWMRCGITLDEARTELREFRKRGRRIGGWANVEVIDGFTFPACDCVIVRNGLVGDYLDSLSGARFPKKKQGVTP